MFMSLRNRLFGSLSASLAVSVAPPANQPQAVAPMLNPGRPVVRIAGVDKVYGNGTVALQDASLEIRDGEFVSLLGPSGCGKSTLLRMIAGLGEASRGEIQWWEQDYGAVGGPGRKLAYVFQEPTLMPWADIRRNVRLPLDLARARGAEADGAVADALRLVGLQDFAGAYPRELSGGMQMRASIARALVTSPNLLLMDEPFGALDEITRNRLNTELLSLWELKRWTVVFVTHSVFEAVFLSSRVVVMAARPGRIIDSIDIEEPFPRTPGFRTSPQFLDYSRRLSLALEAASQEGA